MEVIIDEILQILKRVYHCILEYNIIKQIWTVARCFVFSNWFL